VLNMHSRVAAITVTTAVLLAVQVALAVDVKVDFDKKFDFKSPQTWGWNPDGPGKVLMARTPDDDPEAVKKQVDPIVMDAVTANMKERGLEFTTGTPDVTVTYFLLLSTNTSAQTIGQFVPGAYAWEVPPFLASTQSLEVMNRGSLLLDVNSKGGVVWRGLAQANIRMGTDLKRREALLREAVRDLLRRYPRKS